MFRLGEQIGQKLAADLSQPIQVFNNYPEDLRQFAPCVCVIFSGYNVANVACGMTRVETFWRTDVIVKTSQAMRNKSAAEVMASDVFDQVYASLIGQKLLENSSPLELASTGLQAEVTPAIGFYPLTWRAMLTITSP